MQSKTPLAQAWLNERKAIPKSIRKKTATKKKKGGSIKESVEDFETSLEFKENTGEDTVLSSDLSRDYFGNSITGFDTEGEYTEADGETDFASIAETDEDTVSAVATEVGGIKKRKGMKGKKGDSKKGGKKGKKGGKKGKKNKKGKKGKKREEKSHSIRQSLSSLMMSDASFFNLQYIAHDPPQLMELRGFEWPEGKTKKNKKKGKKGKKSKKGGKKSGKKKTGKKSGKSKRSSGSAKSIKSKTTPSDMMSPAAMENLYFIAHDAPDALEKRGFSLSAGTKKKKKGAKKGKKKKKKK
ncbi:hypothetical protein Btru_022295 [Bulinus truncatus]|nr:hypothetical protein Btru_022295 [Bulinus truncatus]